MVVYGHGATRNEMLGLLPLVRGTRRRVPNKDPNLYLLPFSLPFSYSFSLFRQKTNFVFFSFFYLVSLHIRLSRARNQNFKVSGHERSGRVG